MLCLTQKRPAEKVKQTNLQGKGTDFMKITAYVMAKNEEETIKQCIEAFSWCDEVVLADTGSTDRTTELARGLGATILELPFIGFGPTRNKIIDSLDTDWIVCFDADEVCTEGLANEILSSIRNESHTVLQAPRQNFLMKKKIMHSGWYPDYRHPVAFKKGECRYTDAQIHEGFVTSSEIQKLKEPYAHFSYRRLEQMMGKERSYAMMGVNNALNKNKKPSMATALLHGTSAFIRHFFLKKGFLDGWAGFVIAISSAHSTFFRYAFAYEKVNDLEEKDLSVPKSFISN